MLIDVSEINTSTHFFKKGLTPQIKARLFEIAGCGGFVISESAEDLPNFFKPGMEIETFSGIEDLIRKITFYLQNDNDREAIAYSGWKRTVEEHSYENRFADIFTKMGLASKVKNQPGSGTYQEVT